jgi:resolvase-like protein
MAVRAGWGAVACLRTMSYSQTISMSHCAVLYARVSSKDQEREGFSIPAQLDLLRSYAAARSLRIVEDFVDVETAKQAGRAAFGQMVAFAKKHRGRLCDRLQARIDTMYLDRLDGRITAEFFDAKSKQWRDQQKEIETRMTTPLRSAAEAVQIIRSVSDACGTFQDQPAQQQRALAATLVKQATWKAGKFEMVLAEPYSILAHSNSVSRSREKEKPGSEQEIEIWLPKTNPVTN